jgi:hypothetical protein
LEEGNDDALFEFEKKKKQAIKQSTKELMPSHVSRIGNKTKKKGSKQDQSYDRIYPRGLGMFDRRFGDETPYQT